MPMWSKLKTELDRASRAAANAIDEGKVRLEIFRARQLTDKAAQSLGYAVFRAKAAGNELDQVAMTRLVAAIEEREAEVRRLEDSLRAPAASTAAPDEAGHDTAS
ncbi:MAG: hypothetical protein MNPFHGCM_01009 [Gemmatimonadaceae bacterium]|nr:hypothetical protein [Gemmatimonadaceae bacterium]